MKTKITRRHFIALGVAIGSVSLLGAGTVYFKWWKVPPDEPYLALSKVEADIVKNIAGAAFPGGEAAPLAGEEAGLDRFFDQLIHGMGEPNKDLLKLLLHALENIPSATRFSRFTVLNKSQQTEQLSSWLDSKQHLLRSAVQSLVALLGMGYTTHPKIAPLLAKHHRCGYGNL